MSGWIVWLLVALAGAAGAMVRDVLGQWAGHPRGMDWANRSGAILLGVLAAGVFAGTLDTSVGLVAGTGFCGGLTTFSTLVVTALEEQRPSLAWRETVIGLVLAAVGWLVTVTFVG